MRIVEDTVIGVVIAAVGLISASTLGIVALFAGDEAFGLFVGCAAAALGTYALLVGVSFMRGSPSFGGGIRLSAVGLVVALLLVAILVAALHDREVAPVNRAVEGQYLKRGNYAGVTADCSYIERNSDGSEYWGCDVEVDRPADSDSCNVDLRRFQAGNVRVRITYCLSDDL